MRGRLHLNDLIIDTHIGTYGPGDIVPKQHILDMTLDVHVDQLYVLTDAMEAVFDYDPLVADLLTLAVAQHYETQEYLLSRMIEACAAYTEINGVTLFLRKSPVTSASGQLGVELSADATDLKTLRELR